MKRSGRIRALLWVLGLLVALAGGALLAARYYLSSRNAAGQVASRLQTVFGGTVQVTDADIGLAGGSSLQGLQVYEESADDTEPWIHVDGVQADVSALGLLTGGAMPRR